ncbi:FecR family protein [Filimonas effusa]|uniref:FecR family protein n=1 Tax=Filimonas effusa TaxID=2508721 RepID=UPI0013E91E7C|nr:FecR family protein [Filimonas effusa]
MSNITTILFKVIQETALTDEEQAKLHTWLEAAPENLQLYRSVQDETGLAAKMERFTSYDVPGGFDKFIRLVGGKKQMAPVRKLHRWWAVAAVSLLFISAAWLWFHQEKKGTSNPVAETASLVAPGREGAILTLSDGREILLDSIPDGTTVALQEGAAARVVAGKLVYEGESSKVLFNTMKTPKGRQFQLLLPDGTKVWLNAASSITYPTVFAGGERRIELQGEAYLEVVKNAGAPFIVNVNNKAEIQVLGTQFNVNAYENEALIRTTLLEGAVAVTLPSAAAGGANPQTAVLKPGQQAQIKNLITDDKQPGINQAAQRGDIKVVKDVDTRTVTAWRNGVFNFSGVDFSTVMRQLERWYDIEVIYEKSLPDVQLGGEMSANVSLNQLLGIFDRFRIHYRLDGHRLIILP